MYMTYACILWTFLMVTYFMESPMLTILVHVCRISLLRGSPLSPSPPPTPGIKLSQTIPTCLYMSIYCILQFLNIEKSETSPLEPAIGVLLVNPARWFPHLQAASTFHLVCVDLIVIHRRSHLSFYIKSLEPVRRKFLVYFNRIFLT